MGNYISCISSKVPSDAVKVIGLYGKVQEFQNPMKAAELMLDNPGHFLCHSTAIQTGLRISALSADEELELGQLYFLLPMRKLHSSLSPSEMASLAFKADSALRKSTSNSMSLARILPVLSDLCVCSAYRNLAADDVTDQEIKGVKETSQTEDIVFVPKLRLDDANDFGEVRGLSMRTMSWKPALATISESPRPALPINPLLGQPKKGNHLVKSYSARSLRI